MSNEEAFDEACRLLGAQMVRSALLERELTRAEFERDQAITQLANTVGQAPTPEVPN